MGSAEPAEAGAPHPLSAPSARALPAGTRLILSVAAAGLVLLAVSGGIAWRGYQDERRALLRETSRLAYESAASSSSFVAGRLALLTTYGTRDAFRSGERGAIQAELRDFPGRSLQLDGGALWFDGAGTLAASSTGRTLSVPVLDELVEQVLAEGRSVVSPALDAPALEATAVVLAAPTFAEDGAVNGVLAVGMPLSWLQEAARGQGDRRGTESFLIDSTGQLIAGPGVVDVVPAPPLPELAELDHYEERGFIVIAAQPGAEDPLGRSDRVVGYARNLNITDWTSLEVRADDDVFGTARRTLAERLLAVLAVVAVAVAGTAAFARVMNVLSRRAKRAEAETEVERDIARREHANLRLTLSATSTGWWQWDVGPDRITWSPEVGDIFGVAPGAEPGDGSTVLDLVHPDDRSELVELTRRVAREGSAEVEVRVPTGDEVRWVWIYGTSVYGEGGRVERVVGLVRDITGRRRREERSAVLGGLAEELAVATTAAHVASAVSGAARRGLGCRWAGVVRPGTNGSGGVEDAAVDPPAEPTVALPAVAAGVGATRRGRPVHAGTPAAVAAWSPPGDGSDGGDGSGGRPGALVAYPLTSAGEALGALYAAWPLERTLDAEEETFAQSLATICAQTLGRAELFERQRTVATTLQASLLPNRFPAVPGVGFALRYRAAGPDLDVGGDFYDAVAVGPNRWTVTIGDVCGRGIDAAALTSLARHTLRTAGRHLDDPADMLAWLHDALTIDETDTRFVTATHAVLEVVGDGVILRYSVAGHPRPLLVPAGGRARPVGRTGTLLGVLRPTLYTDELRMGPGDLLVLATDGLTDTPRPRLDEADLLDIIDEVDRRDPDAVADALLNASQPAPGGTHDDTALVVIGVTGVSAGPGPGEGRSGDRRGGAAPVALSFPSPGRGDPPGPQDRPGSRA